MNHLEQENPYLVEFRLYTSNKSVTNNPYWSALSREHGNADYVKFEVLIVATGLFHKPLVTNLHDLECEDVCLHTMYCDDPLSQKIGHCSSTIAHAAEEIFHPWQRSPAGFISIGCRCSHEVFLMCNGLCPLLYEGQRSSKAKSNMARGYGTTRASWWGWLEAILISEMQVDRQTGHGCYWI